MPYFCLAMLYLYIQMDDTKSRLQEFQSAFFSNNTDRIKNFPHYYIVENHIMDMSGVPIAPRKQRKAELKQMAAKRHAKKQNKTFDRPPNPNVSSPNHSSFKRIPSTPKKTHRDQDSEEDNLMTPPHARSPNTITTVPVVIVPSVTPAPARAQTPQLLVIDPNRSKHFANDPVLDVSPPTNSNRKASRTHKNSSKSLITPVEEEVGPTFIFKTPLSVDEYKNLLGPKVILNREAVYPSDEVELCISSMYSEVFKHFKGRIAVNEEEFDDRAKVLRKLHFIGRKGLEKRSSPCIIPGLELNDSEDSSTGSSSKGKGRA
ncbi:uncharacterized protein MELLADRAFT_88988 [Melampsora larici-populina 98AG31]|uniref:Uncharacterized protein n=1 Tax=Melampsora larici-populina (strain 98AG31 / pathotype 3-4-7) TaxID=747676 RepID=F4R6I9_MELLP|nr:uncharacterized protein MELLADRAFT_88988 [Melampsora larici-populina 98AG31]EGG11889.1 hypothetical protein MELLADRAFT_88988 [Melampsora larici-populina 98AG31]